MVLQQLPENLQVLQALAQVCYEQGKLAESIEVLQKACNLQPDAPDIRYSLAVILSQADMQQDAIRHYRDVLKQQPDHVCILLNTQKNLVLEGSKVLLGLKVPTTLQQERPWFLY